MKLSQVNPGTISPESAERLKEFAVTLVFENDKSPFFKSQILEIKALLESKGIPVTVYGLSTAKDSDSVQPELRMMNRDLTLSDEKLSDLPPPDPEKPSLVFVHMDDLSPEWFNGTWNPILRQWAKSRVLAIVPAFGIPEYRGWTVLGHLPDWYLGNTGGNSLLQWTPYEDRMKQEQEQRTQDNCTIIPITILDPKPDMVECGSLNAFMGSFNENDDVKPLYSVCLLLDGEDHRSYTMGYSDKADRQQKLHNALKCKLHALSREAATLLEELIINDTTESITIETLNQIQTDLFGKNDPSINQELFLSFLAPEQDMDWDTDLNSVNFCIPESDALCKFYQSNSINIRLEKPLAGLQASYAKRIFRERIENGSFRRPVVISMDNGTQLPDAVLKILSEKIDFNEFLKTARFPKKPFLHKLLCPIWVSDDTERFSIVINPETYPGSLSEKVSRFFEVLNSDQLSSEQRDAVKASIRDLFKTITQNATKDSHTPAIVASIIDERTDISADALVEAIQHLYRNKDYMPDKVGEFQGNLYSIMDPEFQDISGLLRELHYKRFCEGLRGQIADFRTRTFWDTLNQGSVLEATTAWVSSMKGR